MQIFLFSSPSWDITQFNWYCLVAPCAKTPPQFPFSPYFQSSATPYLLELSEVSLYRGKYSGDVRIRQTPLLYQALISTKDGEFARYKNLIKGIEAQTA